MIKYKSLIWWSERIPANNANSTQGQMISSTQTVNQDARASPLGEEGLVTGLIPPHLRYTLSVQRQQSYLQQS